MRKRETKNGNSGDNPDFSALSIIKSEYLVAFLAMTLIIVGAVVGEKLAPSRSIQTSLTSAEEITDADTATEEIPACSHFAIDDYSGVDSKLVIINPDITQVSLLKTYPCTTGICDFESIETDANGDLISISNSSKEIYKISKSNGELTRLASLSPAFNITGLSFAADGSLWAWVPGRGLFTVNTATGEILEQKASTMSSIDDIAWDNSSNFLYLSRSPGNELHRYDPGDGSISFAGILPGKTDAFDFAPVGYKDGHLMGAYRSGSPGILYFYTYDVESRNIVSKYTINTNYSNLDAISVCAS